MKPTITYGITDMRRCDICKGGNIDISKNCVFHLGPFNGGWKFCGKDICKEIILGWYEKYYGKSFETENEEPKIILDNDPINMTIKELSEFWLTKIQDEKNIENCVEYVGYIFSNSENDNDVFINKLLSILINAYHKEADKIMLKKSLLDCISMDNNSKDFKEEAIRKMYDKIKGWYSQNENLFDKFHQKGEIDNERN